MSLRPVLVTIALAMLVGSSHGQQSRLASSTRFETIDVFIDSSEPLAAWQFELSERTGSMTVVGVENGDNAAFAAAPYYDLAAVAANRADRIIVADFAAGAMTDLPVGSTRIATLHVRLSGSGEPDYLLELVAAGNAAGRPIDAAIRLSAPFGR